MQDVQTENTQIATPVVARRRPKATEELIWRGIEDNPCHRVKQAKRADHAIPYSRTHRGTRTHDRGEEFMCVPSALKTPSSRIRDAKTVRFADSPEPILTNAPRKSRRCRQVQFLVPAVDELAAEIASQPLPALWQAIDSAVSQPKVRQYAASPDSSLDTSDTSDIFNPFGTPRASEKDVLAFLESTIDGIALAA